MLSIRVYICPGCGKRMKSTSGLTRHMNTYTNPIIQQVLPIQIQPKQDMAMLEKNNNTSDNFRSHEDKESILKEQNIKNDYKDLVSKKMNTKCHTREMLSGCTFQGGLLKICLSSSFKEVRFSKQEFLVGIPVSNIKYHQP